MPGKGQVAWDSVDAWEKLVAAIFATGIKVDISSVATHFGATYDTIENRLRPVKRRAKELQEAVRDGTQAKVTSSRKSPSKPPRTPKKPAAALESVSNGRVSKSTPSKKTPKPSLIKQEALENSFSDIVDDSVADLGRLDKPLGAMDFDDGMPSMFDY